MAVKIKHLHTKPEWEQALDSWPAANFLQSWNWGQFHQSLGKNVYYLQVKEGNKNVACALVITESAKRGNYLTIAGGPLLDWSRSDLSTVITPLLAELRRLARLEKAVFVRIRTQEEETPALKTAIERLGFRKSPMHLTADLTLRLDLAVDEATLLSGMRKNTRREIRKADRLKIKIVYSADPAEINEFYRQQLQVAKRQKFIPFSRQFLQQQFDAFLPDDQVMLIHAYLDRQLLASAFVIFYRQEAVYHYGISTEANFKFPGSYACQWAAITEAKKRGLKYYNFWGVAPADQPRHRFARVGIFKRGFGGQEVQYLPAYDYPFSKKYFLIRMFELFRKRVRKL